MFIDTYNAGETKFVSVRKKKHNSMLYVGKQDKLYASFMPISLPYKSYHTFIQEDPFGDYVVTTIVDEENNAHLLIYQAEADKSQINLKYHLTFDNEKYERAFASSGITLNVENDLFFTGLTKDSKLCTCRIEKGRVVSEGVILGLLKNSVRLLKTDGSNYGRLFYVNENGDPRLFLLNLHKHDNVITSRLSKNCKDCFTSASYHIQVITPQISDVSLESSIIAGDDGLYEIYDQASSISKLSFYAHYPQNIKPEDIQKIIVKRKEHGSKGSKGSKASLFLLTKEGNLWLYCETSSPSLFDPVENKWEIIFSNVEDVFPSDSQLVGLLVKTKEDKIYFIGEELQSKLDRIIFPIDRADKINDTIEKAFVAKDISTYIGAVNSEKPEGIIWHSFFLDNNDMYVKGDSFGIGNEKNSLYLWIGNGFTMEDVMIETVVRPLNLFTRLC